MRVEHSAGQQAGYWTIPTRVGKTCVDFRYSDFQPDHPHARGENPNGASLTVGSLGPSPRAWGKLETRAMLSEARRTIPTRVGKTMVAVGGEFRGTDHPHARGENQSLYSSLPIICGPSPRAFAAPCQGIRTIPTRVGKTNSTHLPDRYSPDHPHARGENIAVRSRVWLRCGPSPRAWGKPRYLEQLRG
jgi:hypothetical protein